MKAYELSTPDVDDGCELIFAESRSKAKAKCTLDCPYLELTARRAPNLDKYADKAVNSQLQYDIPEHRKILEEEIGWQELI